MINKNRIVFLLCLWVCSITAIANSGYTSKLITVNDWDKGPRNLGELRAVPPADSMTFFDGHNFMVIGKLHSEKNYNRFPDRYKDKVRKEVWRLGQDAAGISIRFHSNASSIAIRWTVTFNVNMDHMPASGSKGVDLYALVNDRWQYVNTGRAFDKSNEFTLFKDAESIDREYLLNLPLYDGVDSLSIGVNTGATISMPVENKLTANKPVVYYGSSVSQGGVATRPGLAFTNILARKLDCGFVNLGFSGEGTFDIAVGEAMSEVDASLYVIDCNPNTKQELVYDGAVNLVRLLKSRKPGIPILLVENYYFDTDFFRRTKNSVGENKRASLKRAFETLKASGIGQLYYQKGDHLIGHDHEATVDGVHPNDIGMMRIAETLYPTIKKVKLKN